MNTNHEIVVVETPEGDQLNCLIIRAIELHGGTIELLVLRPDGELTYAYDHPR